MGGIIQCESHGLQPPVGVSQRMQDALRAGAPIPAEWLCLVGVIEGDSTWWRYADVEHIAALGLDPAVSPLFLRERNRRQRQLNDRLTIVKLFPLFPNVTWCKQCLAEAIHPLDSPRLRRAARASPETVG